MRCCKEKCQVIIPCCFVSSLRKIQECVGSVLMNLDTNYKVQRFEK